MGQNIEQAYLKLLNDILQRGTEKSDRTGTGTISVFGRQIRHDMKTGFPLLTTKKMYWKGIVTELLWFLRGDTNIKYLVDNDCHIWDGDAYKAYCKWFESQPEEIKEYEGAILPKKDEFINRIKTDDEFAKKWGDLGKIYGYQWRNWNEGIDQIQNLIHDLKTNPDSRRLMVNAWNVGELDKMTLPPCHYGFQVYTSVRNDKRYISLMWNQRSVDTPLGLPFNIASYALLLEIIARSVNMVPDELIGNLGDCHIYKNQVDGVEEQLTRETYPLPKLEINSGNENWYLLDDVNDIINSLDCDLTFKIKDYESHPTIKMPLSN